MTDDSAAVEGERGITDSGNQSADSRDAVKPEGRNEVSRIDPCHSRKTRVTFEPTPELKYKFQSSKSKLSFQMSGDQEWDGDGFKMGLGSAPQCKSGSYNNKRDPRYNGCKGTDGQGIQLARVPALGMPYVSFQVGKYQNIAMF